MQSDSKTIHSRYELLSQKRNPFLMRARACAEVTIPALFPQKGQLGETSFTTTYQSVGSSGVSSLAANLLTTMLPANEPFFRLTVDADSLAALNIEPSDAEEALYSVEKIIQNEIEERSMRVPLFEALKQLIVGGNSLLFITPKDGIRVLRLDHFVVKRDAIGNVLEIIIQENVSPLVLDDNVQKELIANAHANEEEFDYNKDIDLFTQVKRTAKGTWTATQEAGGVLIESTQTTYPKDKCPWLPLRLMAQDGEDYGRSYVEEFLGDLKTLETLSKAMTEGSVAAARVLFLVRPNGTTRPRTLQELPNGGIGQGSAEDVSVLQMNKQADFSVVQHHMSEITQRLERIFLSSASVQRKGERVTAEEIRYMAAALEKNLGGVYSLLSATFQVPLVSLLLFNLQRQKKLPNIPKGLLKPRITTGMSAIGRSSELTKLQQFGQIALQSAQLQQIGEVNVSDYLVQACIAIGLDPKNLIHPPATVQQNANNQQQNQLMQSVAPQIATSMMQNIPH